MSEIQFCFWCKVKDLTFFSFPVNLKPLPYHILNFHIYMGPFLVSLFQGSQAGFYLAHGVFKIGKFCIKAQIFGFSGKTRRSNNNRIKAIETSHFK